VSQDVLWGGHSLQIAPPSISKWDGVLAWCARAGLDPGSVVAIGDGANDVELLANAAVGVAMATGDPAALAVADHVVEQWADLLSLLRLPP
jgi:hydroxymethylpyrimidine pyrophosphatase-like HAD family hydrolase